MPIHPTEYGSSVLCIGSPKPLTPAPPGPCPAPLPPAGAEEYVYLLEKMFMHFLLQKFYSRLLVLSFKKINISRKGK